MKKINIGILSPSNIAFSRFLPSLMGLKGFSYTGVAVASPEEWQGAASSDMLQNELEKANNFHNEFGGDVIKGYRSLLQSSEVDAVYIPLPPALHYHWAMEALKYGKHVLVEKPSTTSVLDTTELVSEAQNRGLALHENYMFQYHSQLTVIRNMISSGELGDIRTYKMAFGFPKRAATDFRYCHAMGGGALLDCGGYPLRLASILLGGSAKVVHARLNYVTDCEVDLFGTAVLENDEGICAHISFGMDNAYQCQLEVWGSKQTLLAPRIFTAGADIRPSLLLRSSVNETTMFLESDDQFMHSIEKFGDCIYETDTRVNEYEELRMQMSLVAEIQKRDLK